MLTLLLAFQAAAAQPPAPPRSEVASLVARAKAARYQQDSALARYEAIAKQRWSASIGLARNLGLGPLGPERLAARFESAVRIGWDHERGAFAELLAARSVAPIVGEVQPAWSDDDAGLVLPYHPGRDRLWPIGELRDALPNVDDWIAHPLANGADSLYLFSLGDSLQIRLPDRSVVRLRRTQSAPISAAGVGFAFLEGLVRLDAARGLDRGAGWRVDFFFELR